MTGAAIDERLYGAVQINLFPVYQPFHELKRVGFEQLKLARNLGEQLGVPLPGFLHKRDAFIIQSGFGETAPGAAIIPDDMIPFVIQERLALRCQCTVLLL